MMLVGGGRVTHTKGKKRADLSKATLDVRETGKKMMLEDRIVYQPSYQSNVIDPNKDIFRQTMPQYF